MLRPLLLASCCLALFSCSHGIERTAFKTTDKGTWARDSIFEFTFSEMDTIGRYNVFINIRNDDTFPYNNLFIIGELLAPNGDTTKDTLEYDMARPDGSWLGKGFGSIKENKLWYKENIVFPSSGVYTLRLSHAMRKNGEVNGVAALQGITDVGYEIVKSKQ